LFLTTSCGRQDSGWTGTITEEAENVTVVRNPMEPMVEEAIQIDKELSIGSVDGPQEYMFGAVRDLAVLPDGTIYVLDSEEDHIKVYDCDGRYLRTIATPGQGPGELDRPMAVCISGNRLYATEGARNISVFSLDGEFERRISTKEIWALRTMVDSLGRFLIASGVMDPENLHYRFAVYDEDMNLIREIATSPAPDARKGFNPFMPIAYWTMGCDDQIVYGYPKEYELQIFDADGELIKRITKDYDPVAITEDEKKEMGEDYQGPSGLTFSDYHSAFRRFFCDDEGRIFVQTWEKAENGKDYIYDVFDPEGRYFTRTVLPTRPHCSLNGKLYTIEEDVDGYHYVKRYRISIRLY
jgi:hypothetical protein